MAWARDTGPIQLWLPGTPLPPLEGVKLVAHNSEFDRFVLWHCLKVETHWSQWFDTAALCSFNQLPRSLDDAGKALFRHGKGEGKRAMTLLSRPRRRSKHNSDEFWTAETKPASFDELYSYCKDDIDIMRMLYYALAELD